MNRFQRTLACTVLALVAGTVSYVSAADERTARSAQWDEAAARQAQEAQRRQREARLRWEYERRRSAAHARMPSTLSASTPSAQAHTDLACPVLVDDDTRRLYRDSLKGRTSSRILRAPDLFRSGSSSNRSSSSGVRVFAAQGTGTANTAPSSSETTPKDRAASHKIQASGWAASSLQPKSGTDTTHQVYLVPSASEPLRQGFVRVINHSAEAGEVQIDPVDDAGRAFDTITLSIDANETVHFNSNDLETGNEGKGLTGSTGTGEGDWRLAFSSDLDIEVLAYIRTTDGFLTVMHDVAPADGDIRRVAIFNPGSNKNQVSRLRLINSTDETAEVTIRGTDDKGMPGTGEVSVSLDSGTAREITAEALESGDDDFDGMLGDGSGKWRLAVESEQSIVAMSLLESPTDHLTNLSTVPEEPEDGVHVVPLFPKAGDESGRQGFVRAINRSDTAGEIRIKAYDETERDYEAVTLGIGANEAVHFNSDDLEQGSPQKGLSGGVGAGEGDWRLELTSDRDIEVLSYIRTEDGFLTAIHDVVPRSAKRHRIAVFNPGSNVNQQSLLRLVNPGGESAELTVVGFDDRGASPGSDVVVSIPPGMSRTLTALELEDGGDFEGALGDGSGKWQLTVNADRPLVAMSLLSSSTGHLTNLSTAPIRGAGPVQTSGEAFEALISPVVQSKCVNCHVEGGTSGHTPLVFMRDTDPDHLMNNLKVFEDYVAEVAGGAERILNKIQGSLAHGGGMQVASGTEEYRGFETLMELLGAEVESPAIVDLFEGVTLESPGRTLLRAAIIFAGRIPTAAEYAMLDGGTEDDLRRAIRGLMQGPAFHEFLIRGANDRLLTDRDDIQGVGVIDPIFGYFVAYNNLNHEKLVAKDPQHGEWGREVDYGIRRAPLELVAHVAEQELDYRSVLTADYIMANPMAAEAYGATTVFDDSADVHEFQPSEIVSYYRTDDSKELEYLRDFGTHVSTPGNLLTEYPHAGILNTTVFLKRYPTTATNRNRARSRWAYYHFLGFDIEKSESRTMDPEVLKDRNNPTMHNPACTVCHERMDPVAGTFQNYDDVGYYRSAYGGLDSLPETYKQGLDHQHFVSVEARSWEERDTFYLTATLSAGTQRVGFAKKSSHNIHVDYLTVDSKDGTFSRRYELEESEDEMCGSAWTGTDYELQIGCAVAVSIEVPADGEYELKGAAYVGYEPPEGVGQSATLAVIVPYYYQYEDTWFRDMLPPSFGGEQAPDDYNYNSIQWLAQRIVEDDRFAQGVVKFWWPAIMGIEVADQPEDQSNADYNTLQFAASAQSAEFDRLADEFRQGSDWSGKGPYNLKDLLVGIAMSRWFRAESVDSADSVRRAALRDVGAKRLLTPEELSRKTETITGFVWNRRRTTYPGWQAVAPEDWTSEDAYGLLYGGIDSGGVAERARNLTPTMAGVAKRHGAAVACSVVMKDLYLVEDGERRLLGGVDRNLSPAYEFGAVLDVEAESEEVKETVVVTGSLSAGNATAVLWLQNELRDDDGTHIRLLHLDKIVLRDASGNDVDVQELEDVDHRCVWGSGNAIVFWDECPIRVPLQVPATGSYSVEVTAWATHEKDHDEPAKLEVILEGDARHATGSKAVREKLAELSRRILGIQVNAESAEVDALYDLFVEVWEGSLDSAETGFDRNRCDWGDDHYYLEGILENAWREPEDGAEWDWEVHGWNQERLQAFFDGIDWTDRHYVAQTWVAVLAYLLSDYRYLYL